MKMSKPRVPFCWECGGKLKTKYTEAIVYGHMRLLHIRCAIAVTKTEAYNRSAPTTLCPTKKIGGYKERD